MRYVLDSNIGVKSLSIWYGRFFESVRLNRALSKAATIDLNAARHGRR